MCFETIGRVTALPADGTALVDIGGAIRRIDLVVLSVEGVEVAEGDWLRTHTGLAIAKLLPHEAAQLLADHRAAQAADAATAGGTPADELASDDGGTRPIGGTV